jgi:exonuclease SbcC
MILAAIEIENYKQYAGAHRIEFPEQGMVAITGPNGAGKTTLFEAIEWCLYGPRTIPLASIPPHGGVGKTVVRVVLESPSEGSRFVVQRELRPSGTRAEIYRQDQPGQTIVHGSREVSEHVAKQLIGLPHGAFVSTFFTRQKELTFFGDVMPTERRVEVARLLGFQTIREAQEELAAERTEARRAALSLRDAYERDAGDRDFRAEVAAAEAAVEVARETERAAAAVAETAEREAEQSREVLDHWLGLQEADAKIDREQVRLDGEIATTEARRINAEAHLVRLEQRAAERATLLPRAEQAEALAFEVQLLDEQRARAERLRGLDGARATETERLVLIARRLRRVVEDHRDDAAGLAPWSWAADDDISPEIGALRLRDAALTLDPEEHRGRVERLILVRTCQRNVDVADGSLAKLRKHFAVLDSEREALLAAGDPQQALSEAEGAEREARDRERSAQQVRAAARKSREEAERLLREMRGRVGEAICPTCTRPLAPADAERIATLLEADIGRLQGEEAGAAKSAAVAERAIAAARAAQAEASRRQAQLAVLAGRLADGEKQIELAEQAHAECRDQWQAALANAGVAAEPGDDEIAAARALAERVTRIVGQIPLLEQLEQQAGEARAALEVAAAAIAELGPVTYDEEGHLAAQAELAEARSAKVQIAEIAKELASGPQYEAQRDEAAAALADLAARREAVAAERAALGFDPDGLAAARAAEASARAAAQSARSALGETRSELHQAQTRLQRVVEDRDRLQRLAEEADRQGREADELDRMVHEFAEFDRFVADRVGPLLADTTERLLSQVTDGKYDRVRFDENYGIEVYDGDEAFELTGFSGGERDVVSLCARLAMSELIGSAALRPPRFLVLDEVFGSLDSERRAQLLGTLGALASSGHFQQVFIVSHVDDVQQSHVMDEAWTVEERDGVSHVIRPVPALAGVE